MGKLKPKTHSLGGRLQELRVWRGYSQAELAESVVVSKSHINRLEHDEVEDPGVRLVRELCRVLQCRQDYLVDGTGNPWLPGKELDDPLPSRDGRYKHNRDKAASKAASDSGEHMIGPSERTVSRTSAPPRGR